MLPTTAQARSRLAALSRHRSPNDPAVDEARRELRAIRAEDYIRSLVESDLTLEQRSRLAAQLLQPVSAA